MAPVLPGCKARLGQVNHKALLAASRAELVSFAVAVVANADDTVADAELLLEHARWPRAHALAVLASEEFGKAAGVMLLSMVPAGLRFKAQPGLLLGRHETKMLGALMMRLLEFGQPGRIGRVLAMADLAAMLDDTKAQASGANEAKKNGLYADMDEDGRLRLPSDVTENDARQSVARAREIAASSRMFRDQEAMARLAAPPENFVALMTPALIAALDSTSSDAGPEETAAMARDFAARLQELAASAGIALPLAP